MALSLGVDPETLTHDSRGWSGKEGSGLLALPEFASRLKLLERVHRKPLAARAFVEWALSVDWNIPIPLAELAGYCVKQPEVVFDAAFDTRVNQALSTYVAPNVSPRDLRVAIEALGHQFASEGERLMIKVADGTTQGRTAALSYSEVAGLSKWPNSPSETLGHLIRASGASGSGAVDSRSINGTAAPSSQSVQYERDDREAAKPAREAAGTMTPVASRRHRISRDLLTPVIESACRTVNSNDSAAVMAELERLARRPDESRPAPLSSVTSGGVQWRDGGTVKTLTRKALSDRLRRRAQAR